MRNQRPIQWKAKWLWSQGRAFENVVIECYGGRVVSIEAKPSKDCRDLGDVCIIPTLVNAHTHLEFSDLQSPIETDGTFADWIGSVVRHRRQRQASLGNRWIEDRCNTYRLGIEESVEAGVGLIVDMVTSPWDPIWLNHAKFELSPPLILYALGETLGTSKERWNESMELSRRMEQWSQQGVERNGASHIECRFGLSPHSPYTTPWKLLEESVANTSKQSGLVSMHLGETEEEIEWIENRTGPLREMVDRYAPDFLTLETERHSLADYFRILSMSRKALAAHCNYLDEASMDVLVRNRERMAVVYCPRTHHAFGHAPHRWREMIDRGIPVFLGTDSRASNPDLDLWKEVRWLFEKDEGPSPDDLLQMITNWPEGFLDGRGLVGRIAQGSIAPILCVPCEADRAESVARLLLSTQPISVHARLEGREAKSP